MRRRLFNMAAALSTLLCITTCVIWLTSYRHFVQVDLPPYEESRGAYQDLFFWSYAGRIYSMEIGDYWTNGPSHRQGLVIEHESGLVARKYGESQHHFFVVSCKSQTFHGVEFGWWQSRNRRWRAIGLSAPDGAIAGITALLPIAWASRRLRKTAQEHSSLCTSCGYDLRATRHRCPECGTTAPA